jgi:hypothetical protein
MTGKLEIIKNRFSNPLSPKNLRIATILIAIYEIVSDHEN